MTTDRFRSLGNRIYDIDMAVQIADNPVEVDVLAWSGNNRTASSQLDFKAAMESDLTEPIIIAHGHVIDGSDRLYKALKMGYKTIPAFVLSNQQAFSIMAIVKTAIKKIHPDVASEIRSQHAGRQKGKKKKEELGHPYYSLETRSQGDKERSCRECGNVIDGDAIYFDRATGDEPWLREKGYLCLSHEGTEVEKWTRCPRKDCGESVPESEWSAHWRTHVAAVSVHARFHNAKVAHCGQCEDDLELENVKKRTLNHDGTVLEEVLASKTAGDVIPAEKFIQRRIEQEEAKMERTPQRVRRILTENDEEFVRRTIEESVSTTPVAEHMLQIPTSDSEWVVPPELDEEGKQWHPGLPKKETAALPNAGLPTTPDFVERIEPRVDPRFQPIVPARGTGAGGGSLEVIEKNPAINEAIDDLGRGIANITGQPAGKPQIIRTKASTKSTHYHTVTDVTGTQYMSVPCGEHIASNVRLAASNKKEKEKMQSLIGEWHDNTTLERELPDEYNIVQLNTIGDHIIEGTMMNHCLNMGTRMMMGQEVPHPITGEPTTIRHMGGQPVLPNDNPDFPFTMSDLVRLHQERGIPWFGFEEQNAGGRRIPPWRYQGPIFSLRTKDGLPKATFFHPENHETGEINPLVAHDVYGVNNRELHDKYRYRIYQYMRDRLDEDTTGADSVTIRWGKHYEGPEDPSTPEELLTDTEILSRAELEEKLAGLDAQYVRNQTNQPTFEERKKEREQQRGLTKTEEELPPVMAHAYGKHGHTFVDETGENYKTVLCSFDRPSVTAARVQSEFNNWRTANSTIKQVAMRDELLDMYGDNTVEVHRFPDDWTIRRLTTVGDHIFEGEMVRHCLRQFARKAIKEGRIPNDMSFPYELSQFPYIMGGTEETNPHNMVVRDKPWRYTGPFYSLRDENGISKATWFHPINQDSSEANQLIAHDIYGMNNTELSNRYKARIYRYMLRNMDIAPEESLATIRWGLTNPYADIDTPEDEITRTEMLTRDGLTARVAEYTKKYQSDEKPQTLKERISHIENFWGWKNGARKKRKYRPSGCECWEGYERVPGTKPCEPGSCRKKTGPVEKEGRIKRSNASLQEELKTRVDRDQEVRSRFTAFPDDPNIIEEMRSIDVDNASFLRGLIQTSGLPGYKEVGGESTDHVWLLAQHADSDPKLQTDVLQRMMDAKENFHPDHIGYLTDRTRSNAGQPQLYGTQLERDETGAFRPASYEGTIDELEARRREIGLEPLSDYLKGAEDFFGREKAK